MNKSSVVFLLLCITAVGSERIPDGTRDGQVHDLGDGRFVAWDEPSGMWLDPDAFWNSYADRAGGKNWGSGRDYPPYDAVNEHDTFLVHLDSGTCLMYFFHTRWRRANDVRRWDDAFNDYSACPNVFD